MAEEKKTELSLKVTLPDSVNEASIEAKVKSAILSAIQKEIEDARSVKPHQADYDRQTYARISHAKIIKPPAR
jgi:hypothetical protein